jgi:hypothetical protein
MPTFYDKLLQVPLMNLSVRFIDRLVQRPWLARLSPQQIWRQVTGYPRNLAYACAWGAAFALMSAAGALGDSHPGQWLPFWQSACGQGRTRACSYVGQFERTLCRAGSGWACNELGNLRSRDGEAIGALASWQLGCEAGFSPACANARDGGLRTAAPMAADYPILLRGSKGPVADVSRQALYARACELRWLEACRVVARAPSPEMSLTSGSYRQP